MKLKRKVELLHNSSKRMVEAQYLPKNGVWWYFFREETWLHLRRTLELGWLVFRKKE